MSELFRLDPPGCGCTDCLTGYSKPLNEASDPEITLLHLDMIDDATGVDWQEIKDRMDAAAQQARRDAIREMLPSRNVAETPE